LDGHHHIKELIQSVIIIDSDREDAEESKKSIPMNCKCDADSDGHSLMSVSVNEDMPNINSDKINLVQLTSQNANAALGALDLKYIISHYHVNIEPHPDEQVTSIRYQTTSVQTDNVSPPFITSDAQTSPLHNLRIDAAVSPICIVMNDVGTDTCHNELIQCAGMTSESFEGICHEAASSDDLEETGCNVQALDEQTKKLNNVEIHPVSDISVSLPSCHVVNDVEIKLTQNCHTLETTVNVITPNDADMVPSPSQNACDSAAAACTSALPGVQCAPEGIVQDGVNNKLISADLSQEHVVSVATQVYTFISLLNSTSCTYLSSPELFACDDLTTVVCNVEDGDVSIKMKDCYQQKKSFSVIDEVGHADMADKMQTAADTQSLHSCVEYCCDGVSLYSSAHMSLPEAVSSSARPSGMDKFSDTTAL